MRNPSGPFFKEAWYWNNIDFLRRYRSSTLSSEGTLKGAYLELLGLSGWRFFNLLQREGIIVDPQDFIGLDSNPEVVARYHGFIPNDENIPESAQRLFPVLYCEDAYRKAIQLATDSRRPIGVFNFDDTKAAGHQYWNVHWGHLLKGVVEPTIKKLGYCAVILNAYVPLSKPKDRVFEHADIISRLLRESGWGGSASSRPTLLGRVPEIIEDQSFKGFSGGFEVYSSCNESGESNLSRMLTTRVIFQQGRKAEVFVK